MTPTGHSATPVQRRAGTCVCPRDLERATPQKCFWERARSAPSGHREVPGRRNPAVKKCPLGRETHNGRGGLSLSLTWYLDVKIYRMRVTLPSHGHARVGKMAPPGRPDRSRREQRDIHGERRQLWCQGHVGRQREVLRDLPAERGRGRRHRRRVAALQPEGAAGEPAPHRGRRGHHRRRHQGAGRLGRRRGSRQGDPVHAGARDHAGLHRRPLRRRPGHDARGDAGARRGPVEDQPAGAGRDGDRPLRDR